MLFNCDGIARQYQLVKLSFQSEQEGWNDNNNACMVSVTTHTVI